MQTRNTLPRPAGVPLTDVSPDTSVNGTRSQPAAFVSSLVFVGPIIELRSV
jgi:hypothetical protein